jgi:hypothetical protein
MLFRKRGYLPHLEGKNATYFVTFRLADSLPNQILKSFEFESNEIVYEAQRQQRRLSQSEIKRINELHSEKIENYLDSGAGNCWLKNPLVAEVVVAALKYFDGIRYVLHAWCVMPNHVHEVFSPEGSQDEKKSDLIPILQI